MNKSIISILTSLVIGSFLITGCSVKSKIEKVSESKSHFDNKLYSGVKDFYKSPIKVNGEKYRIFHQASTGFVSIESIRISATKRANEFCRDINPNSKMKKESEHTSNRIPLPGEFPKIEIIFACIQDNILENNKYDDLKKIKDLYDDGILTEDEYLKEKKKLLTK